MFNNNLKAKLEQDEIPNIKTANPSHVVLLRGLNQSVAQAQQPAASAHAPAAPTAPLPSSITVTGPMMTPMAPGIPVQPIVEVKSEVPKPLWEGVLTWTSSQSAVSPFCELIAYPAHKGETDPSQLYVCSH
jgi:hypothetical protein